MNIDAKEQIVNLSVYLNYLKNWEFDKAQFAAKACFTCFALQRSTGPLKSLRSPKFEPSSADVEAAQLE